MIENPTPQFSGHETFPFRYGWLKKSVDAVANDPGVFNREDATTILGVGKNMVRSIRHWGLATELLEEFDVPGSRTKGIRVSMLGKALVGEGGLDPYLEDPSTLWLLHFNLASKPGRAHTWYWVFNEWKARQFTRSELTHEVEILAKTHPSARATPETVKRDVDCLIRTYVQSMSSRNASLYEDSLDCPLNELGLIQELGERDCYVFHEGNPRGLVDEVFAYTLGKFWEASFPHQETLAFEQVCYHPGGPGRVFRLSHSAILERLERLDLPENNIFSFHESSGLRQVYRRGPLDCQDLLQRVYLGALAVAL